MSGGSSWRSPAAAEHYAGHDLADFAQEFLRRNPEYQRDFAATEERATADQGRADAEREGLARRWGLSFPLRSKPAAIAQPGNLGPRPRSRNGHSRNIGRSPGRPDPCRC
ncbi:MAG: DUF6499 domain-containing protein [Sphingomonadaceae bacterium]